MIVTTAAVGEVTVAANIPEGIPEAVGHTNPTEYNHQPALQWVTTNVMMVSDSRLKSFRLMIMLFFF